MVPFVKLNYASISSCTVVNAITLYTKWWLHSIPCYSIIVVVVDWWFIYIERLYTYSLSQSLGPQYDKAMVAAHEKYAFYWNELNYIRKWIIER